MCLLTYLVVVVAAVVATAIVIVDISGGAVFSHIRLNKKELIC